MAAKQSQWRTGSSGSAWTKSLALPLAQSNLNKQNDLGASYGGNPITVSKWMTAGTVLKMMATHYPDKEAVADKMRRMTFKQWNERSCRLANALNKLGVKKGDRFGIRKGGQVTVPIMFRLAPQRFFYSLNI